MLSKFVVEAAEKVIDDYRTFSGNKNINEIPEVYLSGCVAAGLFKRTGRHAYPERLYMQIARELGKEKDADLTNLFGGWRADIAVYDDGKPCAIIEFKVFEDTTVPLVVRNDLNKMIRLVEGQPVKAYLAVLVTDTYRGILADTRLQEIEALLERKFDSVGQLQSAQTNGVEWKWKFACGIFS